MTRKYSDELVSFLDDSDISKAGIMLAKLCIQANLPAKYVAIALDVSRMTIYSWFRGSYLREKNQDSVRDLIDILKNDLNEGVLPVSDIDGAKLYLEEISGKSMVDPALEKLGKKVEIKKPVEVLPTTRDEQFRLAELYLSRDNRKKAIIWYQKAAEACHIEAQFKLGCIFLSDYEESENIDCIDIAISWYEKAAAAGHIEAQYQLGNLHWEYGYRDKSGFWYQKAVEQGHVEALAGLYKYRENLNIDDIEQEVSWKKEVAELGYIKAQYDLGEIYRDGVADEDNYEAWLIEADSEEADYWFRQAADHNIETEDDNNYSSKAIYELGELYSESFSEESKLIDFELAIFWYSKAAELKDHYLNKFAAYSLGKIYSSKYESLSLEVDFNSAVYWYKKAINKGYCGITQYSLGKIFFQRYKSEASLDNINIAISWLKKAAKEEYELAEYELGEIYSIKYDESLLEEDFTNALHWFEKVANRDKVTYLSMNAHKKLRNLILDKPKIFRIPE